MNWQLFTNNVYWLKRHLLNEVLHSWFSCLALDFETFEGEHGSIMEEHQDRGCDVK